MPRKGPPQKRIILPDPVYGSEMIQRFINRMMVDGKKVTAEKIFYGALKQCEERPASPVWKSSRRRCRTRCPSLKFDLAASAAKPTKCRWRSARTAAEPLLCAG